MYLKETLACNLDCRNFFDERQYFHIKIGEVYIKDLQTVSVNALPLEDVLLKIAAHQSFIHLDGLMEHKRLMG